MKILNLCKFLALVFAITCCQATEGPDQYWTDYQAAKKAGKVRNPLGYLDVLSTRDHGDTERDLIEKQEAILWFMRTGGKKGFADRPATKEERIVMEKALMFATFVQGFYKPLESLTVDYVGCGLNSPNKQVKKVAKHLIEAQKIISLTYVLSNAYLPKRAFDKNVSDIFEEFNEFITCFGGEWKDYILDLPKAFTMERDARARKLIHETISELESPYGLDVKDIVEGFGFKKPVTKSSELEFQRSMLDILSSKYLAFLEQPAAPQKQMPSYRAMRIVTENGFEITRQVTGQMKVVTTRPVQINGTNLSAGVTFSGGGVSFGSFQIPATLSDEELLNRIQTYTTILELTDI